MTDTQDILILAQTAAFLALEKKAEEVVILDVGKLTSYADYFVICSADNERQVSAIARNIDDEMRRAGKRPLSVEGVEQSNWILLDFGSLIVHVFLDEARSYYDLEGFWADAPRLKPDEKLGQETLTKLQEQFSDEKRQAEARLWAS